MELFYGWPATYDAEWWRSEDPALVSRLLQAAPFYHPAGEMELRARYIGYFPPLADVAFGLAALFAIGAVVESAHRQLWPRRLVLGMLLAALVMVVVLAIAKQISVHL
jgi:hypothetical protein